MAEQLDFAALEPAHDTVSSESVGGAASDSSTAGAPSSLPVALAAETFDPTALALRGVRFTRYFSNSPWTRPGVATWMTGPYVRPTRHLYFALTR